jgi:hypothetical protein
MPITFYGDLGNGNDFSKFKKTDVVILDFVTKSVATSETCAASISRNNGSFSEFELVAAAILNVGKF